jgi:hypothetical protein
VNRLVFHWDKCVLAVVAMAAVTACSNEVGAASETSEGAMCAALAADANCECTTTLDAPADRVGEVIKSDDDEEIAGKNLSMCGALLLERFRVGSPEECGALSQLRANDAHYSDFVSRMFDLLARVNEQFAESIRMWELENDLAGKGPYGAARKSWKLARLRETKNDAEKWSKYRKMGEAFRKRYCGESNWPRLGDRVCVSMTP